MEDLRLWKMFDHEFCNRKSVPIYFRSSSCVRLGIGILFAFNELQHLNSLQCQRDKFNFSYKKKQSICLLDDGDVRMSVTRGASSIIVVVKCASSE